jgi:hypothetical protein
VLGSSPSPDDAARCAVLDVQAVEQHFDQDMDVLRAPSAALRPGGAGGQVTDRGLKEAPGRDGVVWVLFGPYPQLRAWAVVDAGAPPLRALRLVHYLSAPAPGPDRRKADRRSGKDRREVIDLDRTGPQRRDSHVRDRRLS